MAEEFKKASKTFNKFLKVTLGNYLRHLFRIRIFNEDIRNLRPPYIVLANHVNFWDPFLLSMCFDEPVYFVTSDIHFRNPVLRWLLKFVGAIAKTKNVSDPRTIKDIIKVKKIGGIIGIFPEGQRSWDGKTLPLYPSTAKLVKMMGLPVVSVIFKGGCLSMPRWARTSRKGLLDMTCKILLRSEEIASHTADEIHGLLTEGLKFDEYEIQRKEMNSYRAPRLAEHLELFLFCCPECKAVGSMKSCFRFFECSGCGYKVEYDEYGFFKGHSGKLHFDNPVDWNRWQLEHLTSLMKSAASRNDFAPLFEDQDIILMSGTGERNQPLKNKRTGKLILYPHEILFEEDQGATLIFPLSDITGENVQINKILEFYFDKTLYRVKSRKKLYPAYKWLKAIEIYKSLSF